MCINLAGGASEVLGCCRFVDLDQAPDIRSKADCLFVRGQQREFMEIGQDITVRNWDGTWTYRPRVLVTPRNA